MRKILLILAVLLAGSFASAETYTITMSGTTADTVAAKKTEVGSTNLGRIQRNTDTCAKYNLASNCTQGAVCAAAGVSGGLSCTAPDALAAGVRIFPDSQAGREGFIQLEWKRLNDAFLRRAIAEDAAPVDCSGWTTQAKSDYCTGKGKPASCLMCEVVP